MPNNGKIKMTRTDVAAMGNVVSVGYCGAQTLLRGVEPFGYASGVYGWNYDVYSIRLPREVRGGDPVTVCTGYRAMPGQRARNAAGYERKAQAVARDTSLTWEQQREQLEALREEFAAWQLGYVRNGSGAWVYGPAAVALMDDDTREELHASQEWDTEEDFFRAYAAAHLARFGEPWELDGPNPVW